MRPQTPPPTPAINDSAIEATRKQALELHRDGKLKQAETLYRRIVARLPTHSDAYHSLGILAMQTGHAAAALVQFKAALERNSSNPRYWLSCVHALLVLGQTEAAREMLEQGRRLGLAGETFDALATLLQAPEVGLQVGVSTPSLPASSRLRANAQETGKLVGLVGRGLHKEAEAFARALIERFPEDGLAWKALGVVLQRQNRRDESLEAKEVAARLLPEDAEAHRNLGNALLQGGSFAAAAACYRRSLAIEPNSPEASSSLGLTLQSLDQREEAEASCRRALELRPEYADGYQNLGLVLERQQRFDEAQACYRRAIQIQPTAADSYGSLGNLLRRQARLAEAELCFRAVVTLRPLDAQATLTLGTVIQLQGRAEEAESVYRRAIGLDPHLAEGWSNLAGALKAQGRLSDAQAEQYYRRSIAINPRLAEVHSNLGSSLQQQGRHIEAEASCRRALELNPDLTEAYSNLAGALQQQGRGAEAETCCRRALAIDPSNADAFNNLGTSLRNRGSYSEAEACYRRALEITPSLAEAHNNLGSLLMKYGRLAEAEDCCRRALALKPGLAEAHTSLGNVLLEMGRLGETEACCRSALAVRPGLMEAHSLLLYCLSHNNTVDSEELLAEHLSFGQRFEAPLRRGWIGHSNLPDPERGLRVGFASADLRDHAVAYFLEPVLEHLAHHPGLELHAYSNDPREDSVTRRLHSQFDHWTTVVGLSASGLAETVRRDRIDILVDLSGHTGGHRLLSFAHKPAPVQASWIGYPGTTGLHAMDYYLADRFFLPREQFASQFVEKIVYLPAVSPFLPSPDSPPVNSLPALEKGHLTLGSFNRLAKISSAVIALWSTLLRALPSAKMVIGAMPQDGQYGSLLEWFSREGIARERLSFYPRHDLRSYLELHHQVDFCLDAFPYGGCTTTSHALWMGVPTLSLAGGTPAGREGTTFLSHVGLEDFIGADQADFLTKGVRWSGNLAALAELRAGLRGRVQRSPLGNPQTIAGGLAEALRTMWRRWCAGLPPEAF